MPRVTTDAELTILALPDRTPHMDVQGFDGSSWYSFEDLEDVDWVRSAEWGENVDDPVSSATIILRMENYFRNISFLRGDGIQQGGGDVLTPNKRIRIYSALTGQGVAPVAADWKLGFDGRTQSIDIGGKKNEIRCLCRGLGGDLTDAFVEDQTEYTSDSMENVIQQILDDWINTSPSTPYTLQTPVSPSFTLNTYIQDKMSIMDAIKAITDLIGWEFRFVFNSGTGGFEPTLFEPPRATVTPDYVLNPDTYKELSSFVIALDTVRNVVRIVFTDSASGDVRKVVESSDGTSISIYGRRFMEIVEDASSPITTVAEATTMADAILADLAFDALRGTVPCVFLWHLQLGDLLGFAVDGYYLGIDIGGAGLKSFRHTLTKGRASTMLSVSGSSKGVGTRRWLELEARPDNAPGANLVPPPIATNVVITPGMGSLFVKYDEPTYTSWAVTELYFAASAITPPTYPAKPASNLLVASGRETEFAITNLVPGLIYHGLLLVIDDHGHWLSSTTIAGTATQRTGPYHENLDGQQDQLLRNNDFNQFTLGPLLMPDNWLVHTGTYDQSGDDNTIDQSTTGAQTGALSLDMFYNATGAVKGPAFESEYIPFERGDLYQFAVHCSASGANSAPELFVEVEEYSIIKGSLGAKLPTTFAISVAHTTYVSAIRTADAACNFIKLRIYAQSTADASTKFTLDLDRASIIRAKGHVESTESIAAFAGISATLITGWTNTILEGLTYSGGTFTIVKPGLWTIGIDAQYVDSVVAIRAFVATILIVVNGVTGAPLSTRVIPSFPFGGTPTSEFAQAFFAISSVFAEGDTIDIYHLLTGTTPTADVELVLDMVQLRREDS